MFRRSAGCRRERRKRRQRRGRRCFPVTKWDPDQEGLRLCKANRILRHENYFAGTSTEFVRPSPLVSRSQRFRHCLWQIGVDALASPRPAMGQPSFEDRKDRCDNGRQSDRQQVPRVPPLERNILRTPKGQLLKNLDNVHRHAKRRMERASLREGLFATVKRTTN